MRSLMYLDTSDARITLDSIDQEDLTKALIYCMTIGVANLTAHRDDATTFESPQNYLFVEVNWEQERISIENVLTSSGEIIGFIASYTEYAEDLMGTGRTRRAYLTFCVDEGELNVRQKLHTLFDDVLNRHKAEVTQELIGHMLS